jgi:hypothetical protein
MLQADRGIGVIVGNHIGLIKPGIGLKLGVFQEA